MIEDEFIYSDLDDNTVYDPIVDYDYKCPICNHFLTNYDAETGYMDCINFDCDYFQYTGYSYTFSNLGYHIYSIIDKESPYISIDTCNGNIVEMKVLVLPEYFAANFEEKIKTLMVFR